MCGEYVCASMYTCMRVPAHKRCLGCLCYMYIGPLDLYFWLICSYFLVCFLRDSHEQMSGYAMPNKDIVFIRKKKRKTFIKRLFSSSSLSTLGWYRLLIWGYWYFSGLSWFQLVLLSVQPFSWCTLHISWISRVTIYSLDILLFLFGTSLLFHVQFTDVSRDRSSDLVSPSL